MKFPLLSVDGSKTDSIEISDKLIKLKVNHKLIKFVIDWQLNHAKPRTAKTKQRNEIRGSTKKIVPQKGGGGARHASKKAPLFVGGGVAHGQGGPSLTDARPAIHRHGRGWQQPRRPRPWRRVPSAFGDA